MERNIRDVPTGLTRRAAIFVRMHGVRLDPLPLNEERDRWLAAGVPGEQIDRVVDFEARWGGLVLPPSPVYDGGPRYLSGDVPTLEPNGWCFEVGTQRSAVPYLFAIGPSGEFGLFGDGGWTALHRGIEGWIESIALARHAALWADTIKVVRGIAVDDLNLEALEKVAEVQGLRDTWWRGADSLVAVYRGEAEVLRHPGTLKAVIYSGLDDWGLRGG